MSVTIVVSIARAARLARIAVVFFFVCVCFLSRHFCSMNHTHTHQRARKKDNNAGTKAKVKVEKGRKNFGEALFLTGGAIGRSHQTQLSRRFLQSIALERGWIRMRGL